MKKIWILPLVAFLLACSCSFPVSLVGDSPAVSTPSVTCRPPEPFPAGNNAAYSLVQLHKTGGDLAVQVQAQAPTAASLGQKMFVEFNASW